MVTYVIITPGVTIADLVLLNPSAPLACSIVAFWHAAALPITLLPTGCPTARWPCSGRCVTKLLAAGMKRVCLRFLTRRDISAAHGKHRQSD
jgi:hypothetical protein